MALLKSIPLPLGSPMPSFTLKDPSGKEFESDSLVDKNGAILIFTCNHCPYAQAIWPRVVDTAARAKALGVSTVAINPNIHPDYPEDSPTNMTALIDQLGIKFPYLVDESQEVAKKFQAQCTPDLYVYDKDKKLVYHGRLDDNWQDEHKVSSHDLLSAVNAMANNLPVSQDQKPSMGCSIKWK